MSYYGLYGINFDGTVVGGMQSHSINLGSTVRHETSSGEVYPRWAALVAQNPGLAFTSVDLRGVLTAIGATGLDIDGLGAGVIAYAEKQADGSTRAGASSHRSYTFVDGMGIRRQITADHQGDAMISGELVAGWNGTDDPIQIADGISLPGGLTDQYRYGLGTATVGNVTIAQKRSLTVDFGFQVRSEGGDSDVWPTHVSAAAIVPTITIRGKDPEWLKSTNVPVTGLIGTQANTIIWLRRRIQDPNGIVVPGFYADASEVHIKIQAAGLITIDPVLDASGNETAETALTINSTFDGSNAPVKVTLDQAIA